MPGYRVRIAGGFEGFHRHLVGHDVVRVRIAAVFVVAQDHVRLEVTDQPDQRRRGPFQRLEREGAGRQRRKRVAFGQAGVHETQPALLDAQHLGRVGHLEAAGTGHVPLGMGLRLPWRGSGCRRAIRPCRWPP